jgi:hypothetical protein
VQLPPTLQGRPFGPEQLAQIQALVGQNRGWSRHRLSRELARLWDWRTPQGQLKDMAARTLLLKLQEQGWIGLPARRMPSPTRSGRAPAGGPPLPAPGPIESVLKELLPLRLQEVSQEGVSPARQQLEAALHRYHCLGYRSRGGTTCNIGSGIGRSALWRRWSLVRPPGNARCATAGSAGPPRNAPGIWKASSTTPVLLSSPGCACRSWPATF